MAITPSLAMIPSGYKAQKLYSAVPTNGDGDFDFTRSTSATRVNKDGFIEEVAVNVPRLDYSDGGCPSLLLEPTRSNLITYSEDFSQSVWSKIGVTELGGFLAPDGTNNAYKITSNSGASGGYIEASGVNWSSGIYTHSIFVKYIDRQFIQSFLPSFISTSFVNYDLFNETVVAGSYIDAGIEKMTNGYLRCWFSFSSSYSGNSALNSVSIISSGSASRGANFNGDVKSLLIYGAQLEQGSYATSYIPNFGNSAGATRVAESNVLATTISLDNDFALFWEGSVFEDDIMLYGGGNLGWYINYTYTNGRIILDEPTGRKIQAYITPSTLVNVKTKILARRSNGVHSIFANGIKLTSDVSVNSNTNLSLSSMFWAYNSTFLKGLKVNNSQVFKIPLTDSEAIALTTI